MEVRARNAKWATAVVLFAGFLLAFFVDFTGQELHQWLGMAAGVVAAYHGWAHRSWVITVARRILEAKGGRGRLYFLIDANLLLGFMVILLTGLLISSWLGAPLADYAAWVDLHIIASVITLGLVVVKVGTHWRWVVNATRAQWAFSRESGSGSAAPVMAACRARGPSRREFLGLMGLVGLAAVLASAKALENVVGQANDGQPNVGSETSEAARTIPASGSSSTCTGKCDRRCSYPGHCHRYTDANNNGRCDWGECA